MTTDHEVRRNEAFDGLNKARAFDIRNYSHFRNCQVPQKKELLEKDDAIFKQDFLDDVVGDQPQGQWSVQKDSSGTIAMIRNLQWPGYNAWHKIKSTKYGSCYVGEGIKNSEFAFML